MKLERCLSGTPAEMRAAQAAMDKALGYPRKGVQVGGGIHVPMPETWDGTGDCPPGWARTASEPLMAKDGTAYLAITGLEMSLVDPAVLLKLTPAERSSLAKVGQASTVNLHDVANDAAEAIAVRNK